MNKVSKRVEGRSNLLDAFDILSERFEAEYRAEEGGSKAVLYSPFPPPSIS